MNDHASTLGRILKATEIDYAPNLHADDAGWKRAAAAMALVGLYAMAFGMGGFKAFQNTGSALLILGSLPFVPAMVRSLRAHPAAWLVVAFFVYVIVRTIAASWVPDAPDVDHWYQARRISRVLLILVAAWWIGGHQGRIHALILFILAGLVAGIVESWLVRDTFFQMFGASRVHFQLHPIRMAIMCGVAAIGLAIFTRPFISAVRARAGTVIAVTAWLLLVALMVQAFIVSQSRGAYVAFLLLAVGYGVLTVWRMVAQRRWPSLTQAAAPALVAVLLVVAVVFQWDTVTRKFDNESEVIAQAMAGDWDNPEPNNFGMRIYLYKWGIDAFFEKPWFGWGTDGPMQVIRHTGKRELPRKFNHFHNNYIDMAVRFGVVGSALFVAMIAALCRAGIRGVEAGVLERRSLTLMVTTIAAFALGSLSFSFLESSHGWFLLILLGGILLSPDLWRESSRMSSVAR